MRISGLLFLAATIVPRGMAAGLPVSTYLRDGFTPAAMAADSGGNLYLAGSAITDPASGATGAAVLKLNPDATGYLYLTYFDAAASDRISALAVDNSGNAYIAGWTANPNFPILGGSASGPAPAGGGDMRSFVAKMNPQGAVVFSILLGGTASSQARGIALTPDGRILVSGIAMSKGFPSTPGAYAVTDSTNQWYLMELDPAGGKILFSATGIGGSAIALDAAGSIYMAGSSIGTGYPTTPGAYQTTFAQGFYCFGFCRASFPGNLQHVTKTDPSASKLIYSTGLNDPDGGAGSTTNTGLAVDAAGNAYVTGTLLEARYPFTVPASPAATSYLTKLDPAGAHVLFSVPVGGGGVQLDASGAVYVGGAVLSIAPVGFRGLPGPQPEVAVPAEFAAIPQVCLPNFITAISGAYAMKVHPDTGAVQDAQWIGGAATSAAGIALAGRKVWIAGTTPGPQLPITSGALMAQPLGPGFLEGAYLAAADFEPSPNPTPSIACVLDGGNLSHAGAISGSQLLSIFGSGLGPATPVSSSDPTAGSLGGVSVTFDETPAPLLYVSSSQVNVAVPAPPAPAGGLPRKSVTMMRLKYAGGTVERQFPFSASNLNLFADLSTDQNPCPGVPSDTPAFQPVAMNADGSRNSCANPATPGSTVSLFAHGAGGFDAPAPELTDLHASVGFGCTALVTSARLITGFVYQIGVSLPASLTPCGISSTGTQGIPLTLTFHDAPAGPFAVPANAAGPEPDFSPPGQPMRMVVWVGP